MRFRLFDLDVDLNAARDLCIPVRFGDDEGKAFGLGPAKTVAVQAGSSAFDVRRGGSCNCETHTLTPHADGTHTEGPGHLLGPRVPVVVTEPVCIAVLIRVSPRLLEGSVDCVAGNHRHDDLVIDRQLIDDALVEALAKVPPGIVPVALVIASAPGALRRRQRHSGTNPPYLTPDAAQLVRERGFKHLLVDLPSLDREDDGGLLSAHRAFFELPPGSLAAAAAPEARSVTELIAVDEDIATGAYALFLQVAPLLADAAPSRPVIAPLKGTP